jgi:hypothetical protein
LEDAPTTGDEGRQIFREEPDADPLACRTGDLRLGGRVAAADPRVPLDRRVSREAFLRDRLAEGDPLRPDDPCAVRAGILPGGLVDGSRRRSADPIEADA